MPRSAALAAVPEDIGGQGGVSPVRHARRAGRPGSGASHGQTPARLTATGRYRSRRADYVIGPDDVLTVVFWRDKDMSADVVVRPDGKISLPLINDVRRAA